jgi:alkanesulfonate monooxygenase SsuD/methylene tetrahydromethanopterin reductase-like flavin-dependent oxidoreductase (luciferase family)
MDKIGIGLVLPMLEHPETGEKPSWKLISQQVAMAETAGFDTVWVADELLWRVPDWHGPSGWWECVALAGAVAASTTTIKVGTWVLSALHRNPGLMVKSVHTLDEVSGGRFVFGLGSGHAGDQGQTFGFPLDRTVGRFEDALEIIVPALRGNIVSHAGKYHGSKSLESRPRGPSNGSIPLMMGAHGPRTMGLAIKYADIWSCFATTSSHPPAFAEMVELFERSCAENDRDSTSIGRSVGVFVEPTPTRNAEQLGFGVTIGGSTDEIVDAIGGFADLGFTRVELIPWPNEPKSVEALAPVVDQLAGP